MHPWTCAGNGAPLCEAPHEHGRNVKVDLKHLMSRVIDELSKRHGAYRYFCARFAEACFIVDEADFARAKEVFMRKHELKSESNWEDWLQKNYKVVMQHCRRYVPAPQELKSRLDRLYGVFKDLVDAATGKPLFSTQGKKAWAALMRHVEKGCVSDPDPTKIELYVRTGESKDGLPIYACCRGTNDIEGYHQKLKVFLEGFNNSPEVGVIVVVALSQRGGDSEQPLSPVQQLADALLREFNFRWNMRMEFLMLGLNADLVNYWDLQRVERLQHLTDGWWPEPLYPGWQSSSSFEPTGEAFGIVAPPSGGGGGEPDEWSGAAGGSAAFIARQDAAAVVRTADARELEDAAEEEGVEEGVGAAELVPSVAWFKERTSHLCATPVRTAAERTHFEKNYQSFKGVQASPGDSTEDGINFTRFAETWNIVAGSDVGLGLRRKLPAHLKRYYGAYVRQTNRAATMKPVVDEHRKLRADGR